MKKPAPQKPKQLDYVQTAVRLPQELHAELQDAAARNGRSKNAEIIARLQMSALDARLIDIATQIAELKAMQRQVLDKL